MGTLHLQDLRCSNDFFRTHGRTAAPKLVQWMTTAKCSYSCPHCLTANLGSYEPLSTREAISLIDEIAALGVSELLLTGGEPLEREDLPELILRMQARAQRWSLNTARKPEGALLQAMRRHPPYFAAVSVDGPEPLHDSFRGKRGAFQEALESVEILSSLTDGKVAVGTTVTRVNYGFLADTLRVVVDSGASSWGLHMLVPEGRAFARDDLQLSASQIQGLLRFVASKRSGFPVMMADEIGYCGELEPWVRDEPFFCGAGRAQCVVLPDGEVTACTTVDRSRSAGSVRRCSLQSIWEHGFAELRKVQLSGACSDCRYAPVCSGGCWLQRCHGSHCYKSSWQRPSTFATTASLAVCLGLASCHRAEPPPETAKSTVVVPVATPPSASAAALESPPDAAVGDRQVDRYGIDVLDGMILRMYFGRRRAPASTQTSLPAQQDPGFEYLSKFQAGPRPTDLSERVAQIRAALATRQRSLQLGILLWRDLSEWCLQGPAPSTRTEDQRRLIASVTREVRDATEQWRVEIFERKLDPFVQRDNEVRHFVVSKAGPPPELAGAERAATKHWPNKVELTRDYLKQHPLGESMRLRIDVASGASVERVTADGRAAIAGSAPLDVFDVLVVGGAGASVTIRWRGESMNATLPASSALGYADVLRMVYERNRAQLDGQADQAGGREASPLWLPALMAKVAALQGNDDNARAQLNHRLAELWMF